MDIQRTIVELGTHAELMQQDGLYARLYAMQFRSSDEDLGILNSAVVLEGGMHA